MTIDESTPHMHALIVPKFVNEKCQEILANKRYFGGRGRLMYYQDDYAICMREGIEKLKGFLSLNRGIRFSKAKNIAVRHWYSMINMKLDERDLEQLCAKAKNSELLEIKIKAIQKTLETYKNYSQKTDIDKQTLLQTNKELQKNIKELKSSEEMTREAMEILSAHYKLPQGAINQALKYAQNNLNKENEIERS